MPQLELSRRPNIKEALSVEDLQWLAGFIDFSVSLRMDVQRHKAIYQGKKYEPYLYAFPAASFERQDRYEVEQLLVLGGGISQFERKNRANPEITDEYFKWSASRAQACDFVEAVYPHLIVKKSLADLFAIWKSAERYEHRELVDIFRSRKKELHKREIGEVAIEATYLAGAFDSSGFVSSYVKNGILNVILDVPNEDLARRIAFEIGGTASTPKKPYVVLATGKEGVEFLKLIRPHLRFKADLADATLMDA